jgi:two-component system response regulator QseB
MKVLLAEDDASLGEAIQASLDYEGLSVDWFQRGDSALSALGLNHYDSVILDIGLPGMNGLEVLRALRDQSNRVPVLLLTALGSVTDRVAGLDHGADDYLVKPFDMDELLARLRALVRRAAGRAEETLTHLDITLTPAARRVEQAGNTVELSRYEYLILNRLMENLDHVYSQQALAEYIYEWNEEAESNTVQVHIHHLRKKLGKSLIKTRRGLGYVIEKAR